MGLLAQRGELIDHEDLEFLFTPKGTRTWKPIPHTVLLNAVETQVKASGLEVTGEEHALSKDKKRYFGVLYCYVNGLLSPGTRGSSNWTIPEGCRLAIGIRNSHDKSLSAAVGLGSEVMVCTNLAFSAEVVLKRKHTRFIERDLVGLIRGAMTTLQKESEGQAEAFKIFRETDVHQSTQLPPMLLALYRQGILSSTMLGPIFDEVTKRGDGFSLPVPFGIRVWDLYNACTRQLNLKISGLEMSRRSVELHNRCLDFCRTSYLGWVRN